MSNTTSNNPASIVFYYLMSDLFTLISGRSQDIASKIKQTDGSDSVMSLAITEDDMEFFNELLKDAVNSIFTIFLKYTISSADAIGFNADFPAGEGAVKCCFVKMINNTGYNPAYISAVDAELEKALKYMVLRDWFIVAKQADEVKSNNELYLAALRNIKNYSFALKKALI